ncbi:MAG: GAF domain-containing protein [Prochloraceae cyanobacterium]|nr:GAF domain-containing protein [Prochloraceae cyanobacterium]
MTQKEEQEKLNRGETKPKATQQSKAKSIVLASAIGMLPVLAVGTTTYYFGNQSINEQIIQARELETDSSVEARLEKQKRLLASLSIGTGATALLAGLLVALWANRTIRSAMTASETASETSSPGEDLQAKIDRNNLNNLLTDAIQHIRASLKEQDILEATVEEVRRILNCDRVVIYSRQEKTRGLIVAESVDPSWPRALGKTIKDPCFEARYDEKYQNGRVRALDNIYEAGMTQCYIDQLEKLEVKANLVVPVVDEGKLHSLLVAHQCSQTRMWQQWEVDLLTQISVQVSFAVNNAQLLANSASVQKQSETEAQWTQFYTDVVGNIRASLQEEDVLKATVKEVRRILQCDRVVVYSREEKTRGLVVAESVAPRWSRALNKTIDDPCFDASYDEQYQNGRVRALDNIYEAKLSKCYVEQLEKLQVKANLVAPILNEGKLLGLLVAHQCSDPRVWQQFEIRWFAQIATQVGFAIDNARLLSSSASIEKQAETEAEWTQFYTDTIQYIRASLKEEDILEATVEEVQKVLQCDRVVIYSREKETRGLVAAESVTPRWSRALGKTIEDPCFDAKYDREYQNGRVRAFDNIYEAGLSSCYVEQLEKLEVKANLVAPILNEGKILGLLVAHQCSEPRVWQQFEIRWFAQIATQVGFAIDNARLLSSSASMEKQAKIESEWTQLFTDTIQYIRSSLKEEHVLHTAVEEVRKVLQCDRVVIYSREKETRGLVVAESVTPRWSRALGQTIEDPCFDASYDEQYQNGRVRAFDNIYEAKLSECYVEQLEKLEVKANLVAPILNEGKLLGLLVAHQCSEPRVWQEFEIRWFAQIATQVGFAIDNTRLLREVDRMSQEAVIISDDRLVGQNLLQGQLPELLRDSKTAVDNFLEEVQHQGDAVKVALEQIQEVVNSAREVLATAQQAETQSQQTSETLQIKQELIDRTSEDLAATSTTVQQASEKLKNLIPFFEKIARVGSSINDLTSRINEQTMNLIIQAGKDEQVDRDYIVSIAETVYSSAQQLTTATAEIKPLIGEIETETNKVSAAVDVSSEKAFGSTKLLKETQQQFEQIAAISNQTIALVSKIAHSAANQEQTSIAANQSILELATLAKQTSEQSIAVAHYLDKLGSFSQESEANLID